MGDRPGSRHLPLGPHRRRAAPPEARGADPTTIGGTVERVTFHNPDTGFCVLRLKVGGRRDLETVVGHLASVAAGEEIRAVGEWLNDLSHGLQFRAASMHTAPPSSLEGIERYLGSGLIRGIGPVFARKLVEAFGDRVFEVIDGQPGRLRDVDGIGPGRAAQIVEAWSGQKVIRDIMVFLYGHGVGTSRAVRIYKTYGADAIALIKENPYRLARDVRGIGFLTADALAQKLGIEKTAAIRARAGIAYALMQAIDEGQCGLPREELVESAKKLLEVPGEIVDAALAAETRRRHGGGRRDGGPRLHLPGVAAHDGASARRLDSGAGGWGAALAGHRRGEGAPVGRSRSWPSRWRTGSGKRCVRPSRRSCSSSPAAPAWARRRLSGPSSRSSAPSASA